MCWVGRIHDKCCLCCIGFVGHVISVSFDISHVVPDKNTVLGAGWVSEDREQYTDRNDSTVVDFHCSARSRPTRRGGCGGDTASRLALELRMFDLLHRGTGGFFLLGSNLFLPFVGNFRVHRVRFVVANGSIGVVASLDKLNRKHGWSIIMSASKFSFLIPVGSCLHSHPRQNLVQ